MGPPRSETTLPPGEEIYLLEQAWFKSCDLSHNLFCLCGDFRQHFLPGPGCFTPVRGGAEGGADGDDEVGDDVLISFDLGTPEDIAGDDG